MTYWLAAVGLTLFGFLAGFSIGEPFLIVGLALVLLWPVRGRPRVFRPALVGVVAFAVGMSLTVPLTCEASSIDGGASVTICRSILGATWSGPGLYNPPPEAFTLGVEVGVAAAAVAALATLAWLRIRSRGTPPA